MIDKYAVELATEYIQKQFASGESADLVGMLNHVDFFERVLMDLDEVNEVMKIIPSVYVQRHDGRIIFTQSHGDREITEVDLARNVQLYHDDFWARYRELQNRKK